MHNVSSIVPLTEHGKLAKVDLLGCRRPTWMKHAVIDSRLCAFLCFTGRVFSLLGADSCKLVFEAEILAKLAWVVQVY